MRVHRSDKSFHLDEYLPSSYSESSDRQSIRTEDDRMLLDAAGMVPLDERSSVGLLGTSSDLYADLDCSVDECSVDSTVQDEEEERKRKKAETLEKKNRCDRAMCYKILAGVLAFILLNVGILVGKTLKSRQDGKQVPSPRITAPPAPPMFAQLPTLTPIATLPPSALMATAAPTPSLVTKPPSVQTFGSFGGGSVSLTTSSPVSTVSTTLKPVGAQLIVAPMTNTPTANPTRSPTTPASIFGNFGFGGGVTPTESPVSPPTITLPPSDVATTTALLPNGATVISAQIVPPAPPETGFGSGGFGV